MTIFNTLIPTALILTLLGACGTEPPPAPQSKAQTDGETGDAVANPPFASDDFNSDDWQANGDDSDIGEIEEPQTKSLDDMLAECGDVDFDNPQAITLQNQFNGLRVVKEGSALGIIDYKVTVDPALQIQASIEKSVTTTNFEVNAEPFLAQGIAEDEVAKRQGTHTTEFFPQARRADVFAQDTTWNGIVCTVQPALRTVNQMGGQNIVVEYEPALPASLSPKADPIRYEEEWQGGPRTWQGIQATVRESSREDLPMGTVLTGTVTIRPIEKSTTVTDGDGATHTIQADVAYELLIDFGGQEKTAAMGLTPVTRFYVDHKARTFSAIQSDQKDGETPVTTFVLNQGLR